MKEYVSIGKNVDVAIDEGLRFLGLQREDVDIKILETGGLFKKAKVCLIYEEPVKQEPVVEEQEVKVEEIKEAEVVAEENVEENESVLAEIEQADKLEVKVEAVEPIQARTPADINEFKARVTEFLNGLIEKFKLEATVNCEIEGDNLKFTIEGEKVGKLIGFRGETLIAIQSLLGRLKVAGEGKFRAYLDISGYKQKREQTLVDLANKMADKAEEIERNVHLDPMTAYERRIIHSTLQNRELVETESMGEGEKRHVVIKFKR